MNTEHAGKAKYLSKQMEESDRNEWEDENMDIMKNLLVEKMKTYELLCKHLLVGTFSHR